MRALRATSRRRLQRRGMHSNTSKRQHRSRLRSRRSPPALGFQHAAAHMRSTTLPRAPHVRRARRAAARARGRRAGPLHAQQHEHARADAAHAAARECRGVWAARAASTAGWARGRSTRMVPARRDISRPSRRRRRHNRAAAAAAEWRRSGIGEVLSGHAQCLWGPGGVGRRRARSSHRR